MTAEAQEAAQQLFFISVECNGPDEAGIVPVAEEVFKAVQASAEANGNRPVIDKIKGEGPGYPPFQVLRIEVEAVGAAATGRHRRPGDRPMAQTQCPAETDRRAVAELVGHTFIKSQNADVWVWSDGCVTKRMGKRDKRFAWWPDGGADAFLANNPKCRGYDASAFERI